MRFRQLGFGLVFTAAAVLAPLGVQTAVVAGGETLGAGQVSPIDYGTPIPPPAVQRVSTDGAVVDVMGLEFAGSIAGFDAAPGAQLVAFAVTVNWDQDTNYANSLIEQPVDLTLTSGTTTISETVPYDLGETARNAYVAGIPAGGPVSLTVSRAGVLPQTLDLRTDRLTGPVPQILYRDPTESGVWIKPTATTDFSASTPQGTATGQFGVSEAWLSWWQPNSTTAFPTNPALAYLDVEMDLSDLQVPGVPSGEAGVDGTLPAGVIKFELPDGQVIPSQVYNYPMQNPGDLFSGDFYALVPADTTSFKVIFPATSVPISIPDASDFGTSAVNMTFPAPVTTTVTFTTPPGSAAQPLELNGRPARSTTTPDVRRITHHPGLSVGLIITLFVVAAVILATIAIGRRQRNRQQVWVPVRPVSWPPAYLDPAAVRALTPPRLALPAGDVAELRDAARQDQPGTAQTPAPAVCLGLLGPRQIDGLRRPITRTSALRLLIVLALNAERPMTADELATAISDNPNRDPKPASIHTYASILRAALPAGMLPEAAAAGYQLRTDLLWFDWAVLAQVAAEENSAPGWAERATAALDLVRDRPLLGASWAGIEAVVRVMTATIERLAHDLARTQLAAGNAPAAETAASRGLVVIPASPLLWQDRLDAAASGSGQGLDRIWNDARTALDADAGLIAAHYQQLRRQVSDWPTANT